MDSVLDLENKNQWQKFLVPIVNQFLETECINKVEASYDFLENYSLNNEVCQLLIGKIIDNISKHYGFVVGYHGTRTKNIGNFQDNGLIPLGEELIKILVGQASSEYNFSEIEKDQLCNASTICDIKNRSGSIYFYLDKRRLFETQGEQYLKYGSEYIQIQASSLETFKKDKLFTDIVSEHLKPYLLKCKIPISYLTESSKRDVAKNILISYVENKIKLQEKISISLASIEISRQLESKYILDIVKQNE